MADNTRQWDEIVRIVQGLKHQYRADPNVFVAGNLFWYPVEGRNDIRTAPDALVVFGRPPGYRGAYLQWKEEGKAPRVVFEVLSPGNRQGKMIRKFRFFERYGVEEYYLYDPDDGTLDGWLRQGEELVEIAEMNGFRSPSLDIRFELLPTGELELYHPNGEKFMTVVEALAQLEQEKQRADAAEGHVQRLLAQMRNLGIEPTNGTSSPASES
jgi:Uma2 family endonuclease